MALMKLGICYRRMKTECFWPDLNNINLVCLLFATRDLENKTNKLLKEKFNASVI